jgi:hypothetical protein
MARTWRLFTVQGLSWPRACRYSIGPFNFHNSLGPATTNQVLARRFPVYNRFAYANNRGGLFQLFSKACRSASARNTARSSRRAQERRQIARKKRQRRRTNDWGTAPSLAYTLPGYGKVEHIWRIRFATSKS